MACTNAASDFSCDSPALPGLTYSRWITRTFGGAWACAMHGTRQSSDTRSNRPLRLFMGTKPPRYAFRRNYWNSRYPGENSAGRIVYCAGSVKLGERQDRLAEFGVVFAGDFFDLG